MCGFVLTETITDICDFYHEQCWEQWLRKTANGLTGSREEVLKLPRTVARLLSGKSLSTPGE